MVGDERLSSSTTGNGVHHRSLDFGEITVVKELTDVADNLGARAQDITGLIVHDKIQVALAETLLLVLETVVLGRNGVQARRQQNNLSSEDGKLAVIAVLRVGTTRETNNTDDIASAEKLVLLLERLASRELCLADNLDLNTLRTDIVEVQLVTGGTLGVDTASNANGNIGLLLALLETGVVLEEVAEVGIDQELVRVRIRLLSFAQLVDFLATDLEVLLECLD